MELARAQLVNIYAFFYIIYWLFDYLFNESDNRAVIILCEHEVRIGLTNVYSPKEAETSCNNNINLLSLYEELLSSIDAYLYILSDVQQVIIYLETFSGNTVNVKSNIYLYIISNNIIV